MAYKVTKPIPVNDGVIPTGTIVDASEWRNLRTLISGRYLVEVPDAPAAPAPAVPKRGRPAAAPTPSEK